MIEVPSWQSVVEPWQLAFDLAWETYCEGSNPIAAVIVDRNNNVVATGKSAVRANVSNVITNHCEIAHAEVNALLRLDNRLHDKEAAAGYTLFSTMEPCPLCMSAIYMSDVKALSYAARDSFGGSVNLLGATPYLSRKSRRVEGPVTGLGEVSIFLNVYYNVRYATGADAVHEAFAEDYPDTVNAATSLGEGDRLDFDEKPDTSVMFECVRDALSRP